MVPMALVINQLTWGVNAYSDLREFMRLSDGFTESLETSMVSNVSFVTSLLKEG